MKNLVVAILLLCSCENFPKDPSGTPDRTTNGKLRVGYSENPPWVPVPSRMKMAKHVIAVIQGENRFLVAATEKNVIENAEANVKKVKQLNRFIHEFNIIPVKSLLGR